MNHAQEVLLTKDELAAIAAASNDPLLQDSSVINLMPPGKTAVQRVSRKNALIFIRGDEYTGLAHIVARHSYHSLKRTFQMSVSPQGEQNVRLDDPSRFRPATVPILDFPVIADAIYSQGTVDLVGNHRPEVFDKYVGSFTFPDGVAEKHTLLLYKGTKVVHTLFPQREKNNRKRLEGFLLKRGQVSSSWHLSAAVHSVTIPYFNFTGKRKYDLIIGYSPGWQEIVVWAYNSKGERDGFILMDERPHNGFAEGIPQEDLLWLQYADLRWCERVMRDTEDGKIQRRPEA